MSQDEKPFTVKDRRHFTAEGEARAVGEDAPAPAPVEEQRTAARREPRRAPAAHPDTPEVDPARAFGDLLFSLGAQASAMLGLGSDEPADLRGARGVITALEVLQEKTRGHRTPEEDRLLEGLLYELRMAYVARAKAATP